MIKAEQKKKCLALFLRGYSIRQIAQKVDVSRSTLEKWSVRESWVENRDAFQNESQRIAAKAMLQHDIQKLVQAGEIAMTELTHSFNLINAARNRRYSAKTVRRLQRNAINQAKIFSKLFDAQTLYLDQRKTIEEIEKAFQERRRQNAASDLKIQVNADEQ